MDYSCDNDGIFIISVSLIMNIIGAGFILISFGLIIKAGDTYINPAINLSRTLSIIIISLMCTLIACILSEREYRAVAAVITLSGVVLCILGLTWLNVLFWGYLWEGYIVTGALLLLVLFKIYRVCSRMD